MDVALLVMFWQLAHMHPIHVLSGPELNLVGALQRSTVSRGRPGQTRCGARQLCLRRPAPRPPFLGAEGVPLAGTGAGRRQ